MTNEEAIAYGKRVIDLGLNDETQAFCELSIKALETIPKYKDAYNKGWDDGAKATYEHLKMCEEEQSGDLISRDVVLDALYALCDTGETLKENPWRDNPHIDALVDAIESLPSVNPQEPKTGHWVEENINEWSRKVFCSECGCTSPFEHVSNGDIYSASGYGVNIKTKFCPNCGAKMSESEDEE